ncbi:MAG: hypothetical protein D8M26_13515 [Ignavibacteriae bacterium]|nr:hypothetical protein [Ignavibacteriota bacterium]MCE7855093.1 hypothetical protein [Ignavibacteria bacterium CHB3]GJQ42663.1 MAG: hypothetical protein JETCAE03_21610 [Ignavibacteriaceae bacterium]
MKVLKGTSAWIEGKKFKEGSAIPQKYEKEFEKFLVELPDLPAVQPSPSAKKEKDTTKKETK